MHAYKIICPLCLYTCGNTGKPREAMWTRRHGTHACFDFSLSSSRALTCCFSLSLLFFNLVFEREPHAFFDNASTWLLVASKCAHMCTDIRGKGGRGCDTQRRTSTAANTAQSQHPVQVNRSTQHRSATAYHTGRRNTQHGPVHPTQIRTPSTGEPQHPEQVSQ